MVALIADFGRLEKPKKLPQPKLLTYEDYVKLTPPNSGNYELHNGTIIHMASPTISHQDVCLNIATEIKNYLRKNPIGKVYIAPLDTTFNPNDTFQPDVMFVSKDRVAALEGVKKRLLGAPDLAVEGLSEGNSNKEMSYKKHIFETYGVKEYWLVNVAKRTLTQYENVGDEMVIRNILKEGDTLKSIVVEGFEMTLDAIFETN